MAKDYKLTFFLVDNKRHISLCDYEGNLLPRKVLEEMLRRLNIAVNLISEVQSPIHTQLIKHCSDISEPWNLSNDIIPVWTPNLYDKVKVLTDLGIGCVDNIGYFCGSVIQDVSSGVRFQSCSAFAKQFEMVHMANQTEKFRLLPYAGEDAKTIAKVIAADDGFVVANNDRVILHQTKMDDKIVRDSAWEAYVRVGAETYPVGDGSYITWQDMAYQRRTLGQYRWLKSVVEANLHGVKRIQTAIKVPEGYTPIYQPD